MGDMAKKKSVYIYKKTLFHILSNVVKITLHSNIVTTLQSKQIKNNENE